MKKNLISVVSVDGQHNLMQSVVITVICISIIEKDVVGILKFSDLFQFMNPVHFGCPQAQIIF